MEKIKEIINTSFLQLLIAYTILASISSISIFTRFTLHFEILAVILAIFAIINIKEEKEIKIGDYWIIVALLFVLIIRLIPYLHNSVPLGYDPGLYQYVMQNPNAKDQWVVGGFEPGLFLISNALRFMGVSSNTILTYGLVFLELLLGISVYFATKKFFNKKTAILSVLLYAVSVTQFIAFAYLYYKQIVGMILLLWSLYLTQDEKPTRKKTALLIACASFLGAVHRPTFLIFGLIFLANTIHRSYARRKIDARNILTGTSILIITLLFYVGRIKEIILPWLAPIATASIGAGTFIDLTHYSLYCLAYLPFALLGFIFLAQKKQFNLPWIFFLINGIIVLFKLIFYNRYIISLDIAMIILAAYGLTLLLQHKKLGTAIAVILISSSAYVVAIDATQAKPLVDQDELNVIKALDIPPGSFVMSTDSYYSPWLLYATPNVIAPGMFDHDKWSEDEWRQFWNNTNVKPLMQRLDQPLFVFVGRNQPINEDIFANECFHLETNQSDTRLYRFTC